VLIVDDHPGFRGWARRVLQAEGFGVVGEAADGAAAIQAVGVLPAASRPAERREHGVV
jgi:DNA-binding NarL/FixJ family response regulator